MTTLREAAQQALATMLEGYWGDSKKGYLSTIEALRKALAQPESEPGCRVCGSPIGSLHMAAGNLKCGWPARVQASDCEPEGTHILRTLASDREALVARLKSAHEVNTRVNAMHGSQRRKTIYLEAANMFAARSLDHPIWMAMYLFT